MTAISAPSSGWGQGQECDGGWGERLGERSRAGLAAGGLAIIGVSYPHQDRRESAPAEPGDAARVDGASEWRIFALTTHHW